MKRSYTAFPLAILSLSCLCIFVGAISPLFTIPALFFSAAAAFIAAGISIKDPSSAICKGLLILLCTQNFAIGMGAHLSGNKSDLLGYLTQIPSLTIFIIWISIFISDRYRHRRLQIIDKIFFVLCIFIFLAFLINRGSFQAIVITVRNITIFYMVYRIGYHNLKNEENLFSFCRFFILLTVILIVVGELILLGGYPLQRSLGIHEVYIAKGSPFEEGALDSRFYTTLIKTQYLRMGSLYFEPINLAYLFAAAFIVSLSIPIYKDPLTKYLISSIIFIGLIQTVGKGGYLIIGIIFCCYLAEKIHYFFLSRIPSKRSRKNIIIGILICVLLFFIFYIKYIGAAVMPHIWGITDTWESVLKKPWGYGLGTGGNAAQIVGTGNSEDWFSTGGETALMSFMYQIGILGVICFILCVLQTMVSRTNKFTPFYYVPIALLVVSLLQDNTFTPQCITAFMLVQGGVKAVMAQPEKRLAGNSI